MNYVALGKNIRKYRLVAGMTQEKLAELCNCSNSHIGQIEHARTTPSLEITVRIALALNVTVDQLLSDSYTHPERVYLKNIAVRIEGYSLTKRVRLCEYLNRCLDTVEDFDRTAT